MRVLYSFLYIFFFWIFDLLELSVEMPILDPPKLTGNLPLPGGKDPLMFSRELGQKLALLNKQVAEFRKRV